MRKRAESVAEVINACQRRLRVLRGHCGDGHRTAVDARIERGRTAIHALQKLWEVEHFDRILVPAPTPGKPGFQILAALRKPTFSSSSAC